MRWRIVHDLTSVTSDHSAIREAVAMSELAHAIERRKPGMSPLVVGTGVEIRLEARCYDCKHFHPIVGTPADWLGRMSEWEVKHRGHEVEFLSPKRSIPRGFDDRFYQKEGEAPWWLEWRENSDLKIAYAADGQFTITLASLASSSTFLAGREATSVSNGSNKYLDYEITGKVTTGTTPTVDREIRLYAVKPINDTPTWPDVFDGTDSDETVTNAYILDKLILLWAGSNSATSNVTYPIISALTLAQAWGLVPDNFTVFVAHSTAVNLNSTAGNHELSYRGIYLTST
jgi:hypothetical protein